MDMSQILGMLQMAWDPEDGNAPEDADPPIPHAHRSGPRPAAGGGAGNAAASDPFSPGNLTAAALLGQLAGAAQQAQQPEPVLAAGAGDGAQPVQQQERERQGNNAGAGALAEVDPAAAELRAVRARVMLRRGAIVAPGPANPTTTANGTGMLRPYLSPLTSADLRAAAFV